MNQYYVRPLFRIKIKRRILGTNEREKWNLLLVANWSMTTKGGNFEWQIDGTDVSFENKKTDGREQLTYLTI